MTTDIFVNLPVRDLNFRTSTVTSGNLSTWSRAQSTKRSANETCIDVRGAIGFRRGKRS